MTAIILAGCTGVMNTPTPTPAPTVTPAPTEMVMQPNQTITNPINKTTPTPPPDLLVHGIVTVDGKPVENYAIQVSFPINMGSSTTMARTGKDGSYAIRMDPKLLRDTTYSRLIVSDNHGTKVYSDNYTYRIDGQPLNFAFVTQSGSPSIMPPSTPISSRITPTPITGPTRTAKAPVQTTSMVSYVGFTVYDDKVIVDYSSGYGKLRVSSSNMGGDGTYQGYLREPGDNLTLAFNISMYRELPEGDARIDVYQPTENGMTPGGVEYYPRTGKMRTIN